MKLKVEQYSDISKLTSKRQEEFFTVVASCFPYAFIDKEAFSDLNLSLYVNEKNKIVGFICTKEINKQFIEINYVGVIQDKKYLNKGIATKMINDLIKTYNNHNILLNCSTLNDEGKYLYQKIGFEIYDLKEFFYGDKMYKMVYDSNKRYRDIASVLYEIYKENIKRNESLEDTLFTMFSNKEYDNIYQYNIEEKEIDNIILKNKLFPRCLSVISQARELVEENKVLEFIEKEITNKKEKEIESKIDILNILDNNALNELTRIFRNIIIKTVDNDLSKRR